MKGKFTHDSHVKKLLSDKERAIAYFKEYLPKEILKGLKLEDIQLIDKSFVGKKNRQFHADLLFYIPGTRENFYFYILFEHKSYYDKEIFCQLLGYMSSIYKWQLAEKTHIDKTKKEPGKALDVVIPFVFYHGKEKWDLGTQFIDNFSRELGSESRKFIPNFEIVLFELTESKKLSSRLPDYLYYNLQVMQIIRRSREEIVIWLESLISESKKYENTSNFIAMCKDIIEYLEGTVDESKSIIQEVQNKKERFFMGMFAELEAKAIERGWAKGLEKGIEKGLEQGIEKGINQGLEKGAILGKMETARKLREEGDPIDRIVRITGLSKEELAQEGII